MFISNPTLILIAFASAFLSRILSGVGFPSIVNFTHFAFIPFVFGVALGTSRSTSRLQILLTKQLLFGLIILFAINIVSALVNDAGVINAVIEFLLLSEPFIFLIALTCLPLRIKHTERLRVWLQYFAFINLFFALFQGLVLRLQTINPDHIKGVFIGQGAGHVVGASVSLTFGTYFLFCNKKYSFWQRQGVFLLCCVHVILADAKQVFLVFLLAGVFLLITKLKDVKEFTQYAIALVIALISLRWASETVLPALKTWARPEIYGPDGEATQLKLSVFRIVSHYYDTPLNWLFGLGPGHTVGRLGGWMLKEYWNLLGPLGGTIHPASAEVWRAVSESWLGNQSSIFSPLFGWAGLWGDLGLLGLVTYLYLAFLVWHYLCQSDISKFFLFTIFVFAFIFSQLEEPGYMLFVAFLVGLEWHKQRSFNDFQQFSTL